VRKDEEEDKEEKCKELWTNFEVVYLCDGYVDLTEIWNGMCATMRNVPQQKWCSSFQALLSYRCEKTVFSWFLDNSHLFVVPILAVLGRTTHYFVS